MHIAHILKAQNFALPPSNGGDLELRKAVSAFFNSYLRPIHPVKQEHIVLTAGATDAIENVVHAICDDGDSVIVPGPYWRE
jgi:aspartate/methionine/tyrosine aminotransferase